MAAPSRLYLPSTGASAVNPAIDAGWEYSTGFTRRACVSTRISSAMADASITDVSVAANRDVLVRQYVSAAIAAGPITGTVKGQIRCFDAGSGVRAQIVIRVVDSTGATFRGTLLNFDTAADAQGFVDFAYTNRKFPRAGVVAVTTVVAQTNDRIVIEVGGRQSDGTNVGQPWLSLGDDSATDLPENETTTAANNPWIEFSVDLFAARGAVPQRAYILE